MLASFPGLGTRLMCTSPSSGTLMAGACYFKIIFSVSLRLQTYNTTRIPREVQLVLCACRTKNTLTHQNQHMQLVNIPHTCFCANSSYSSSLASPAMLPRPHCTVLRDCPYCACSVTWATSQSFFFGGLCVYPLAIPADQNASKTGR